MRNESGSGPVPRRPVLGALALLSAAVVILAGPGTSSATAQPRAGIGIPGVASDDGSRVVSETVVDARMVDLAIASVAMGRTMMTRLILPRYWASAPTTRWPSLWLLEGSGDPADYTGWTVHTAVENFVADKDVLVVIPTDGPAGLYTDWTGPSTTGLPQRWETFHTQELPQLLQRGYRASGVNAAAGDSTGGLGALSYAARHPGLFRAAASLSGLVNLGDPGARSAVYLMELRDNDNPGGPFGPAWTTGSWDAHDPTHLVRQLAGVRLFVSAGSGLPGALGWNPGGAVLEASVRQQSEAFVRAARGAGLTVTTDFSATGDHEWPYWNRELAVAWPTLAAGLGLPAASG